MFGHLFNRLQCAITIGILSPLSALPFSCIVRCALTLSIHQKLIRIVRLRCLSHSHSHSHCFPGPIAARWNIQYEETHWCLSARLLLFRCIYDSMINTRIVFFCRELFYWHLGAWATQLQFPRYALFKPSETYRVDNESLLALDSAYGERETGCLSQQCNCWLTQTRAVIEWEVMNE